MINEKKRGINDKQESISWKDLNHAQKKTTRKTTIIH